MARGCYRRTSQSSCRFRALGCSLFLSPTLTIPLGHAPEDANETHHPYKLIDIGTFGGPQSFANELNAFINAAGEFNRMGGVVGGATTTVPLTASSNPLGCSGLGGPLGFVMQSYE